MSNRLIQCVKLQKLAEGMAHPPYPGEVGERLYTQVSQEAWQLWLQHQVILINENKLRLTDLTAREFLHAEMEKFFFS